MTKIIKIIYIILFSLFSCAYGNASIRDGLFATVGNKAITHSDIVNEIKILLILNNESYTDTKKDMLQKMAIASNIKRKIKLIEIEKKNFLQFNEQDLEKELMRLASNINLDIDTLRDVCFSNGVDFSLIKDQVRIDLLWNSLIFHLYKDRISINADEIEEQIKNTQNKKFINEYLISEIVLKSTEKSKLREKIKELLDKINIDGFEQAARELSVSDTAIRGGDLGWLDENQISKKFRSKIINTPIGGISEPIILPEGILLFKVRDKKQIEKNINLEEIKNAIVHAEKSKILNMYSLTHYDSLRRSISIKFFNE